MQEERSHGWQKQRSTSEKVLQRHLKADTLSDAWSNYRVPNSSRKKHKPRKSICT
jgi:hypothetical protein